MLLYRLDTLTDDKKEDFEIPNFIQEEIKKENNEFEEERKQYEIRRDTLHIQIVLSAGNPDEKSHMVSIYKKKTIAEATVIILLFFLFFN